MEPVQTLAQAIHQAVDMALAADPYGVVIIERQQDSTATVHTDGGHLFMVGSCFGPEGASDADRVIVYDAPGAPQVHIGE